MRDKRLRELIYEYQLTKNMEKKDSIISEVMDYYSHVVRLELLSNYAYLSKDPTKYNYLINIGQTAAIEAIETYQTAGKDSFEGHLAALEANLTLGARAGLRALVTAC